MEDSEAAEQLFLLEILMEKITFRKATLLKYYQTKKDARLPLMVKIRFCGLPPFEINQEAVRSPNSLDFGKVGEFNCGESCLFSMDPATLTRNIKRSPLQMTVLRKRKGDVPPDFLGTAQAYLPENMIETVQKVARSVALPLACVYEDTVNIRGEDNEEAGFLTLFVRLSCFGKSIITQFKLMKETRSFLFKSATADEPCICGTVEKGEFPLDDPTKNEMCIQQGNTVCGYNASLVGNTQGPEATPGPLPGEMLGFGDFGMTLLHRSSQKPLYGLCSGDSNTLTSPDIKSLLKSPSIHIQHDLILQNYLNFPVSKLCMQTIGKNTVCRNFSGLVTVISPGKPPRLSTEHLRGGVCKGEESSHRSRTVSLCGTGSNISDRQAGPCSVTTPVQRLCCCQACTNMKDVTPPRYRNDVRSIQDVVPVTPIICAQDELIDPDMEEQLDTEKMETRTREWKEAFCFCWGGSEEPEFEEIPEGEYKMTNPPIRYDTTGALTAAAGGQRPVPLGQLVINDNPDEPNPPIRYDTTGALSRPGDMTSDGEYKAANPPIRYDTTGALTAAAGGRRPVPLGHLVVNADPSAPNPPIRYNTTSALTSSDGIVVVPGGEYRMANPPIRYDTTGALTEAAGGQRPVPEGSLVVNADPNAPNPPIRYDTTGALSPAYVSPTEQQLQEEELPKEEEVVEEYEEETETFIALFEERDIGEIDTTLEELFPQYFVPDTFLEQELECIIRATRKSRRKSQRKRSEDLPFLPPGVLIGHRHCVEWEPRVPAKQGWLWNSINGICGLPFRPGWKPGAVKRTLDVEGSDYDKRGRRSRRRRKDKTKRREELLDKAMMPPTLHIVKKKGIYFITMRPMDMPPDDLTPPVTFRLPPLAEGEVDECAVESMSSGSSDLEIEFCAPGTYPPEFPPKDISIQCSLSQGLVTTASSGSQQKPQPQKKKGKGKKKK